MTINLLLVLVLTLKVLLIDILDLNIFDPDLQLLIKLDNMFQPEGLQHVIFSEHRVFLHLEHAHELSDHALTLLHCDLRGAHEVYDCPQQLKVLLDRLGGSLIQVFAEVKGWVLFLGYFVVNNLKL